MTIEAIKDLRRTVLFVLKYIIFQKQKILSYLA